MKVIWEESDIIPGIRVKKGNVSEEFIIGYDPSKHSKNTPAFLLASLSDGMIIKMPNTIKECVEWLNNSGYVPSDVFGIVRNYTK